MRFQKNTKSVLPTSANIPVLLASNLPLTYLESFCHESLDIRSVEEVDKLGFVQKQISAFWPILTDILNLEGIKYLPVDVRAIVLKLVAIRRNTFINAATRSNADYTDWLSPEAEDPTQFYPEFLIFCYPKRYTVSCQKDSATKKDFSYGVFSIGCCCNLNITYGFELMLCKESAHNFFRKTVKICQVLLFGNGSNTTCCGKYRYSYS